ncbi:MAG: hypothetical protein Sapg2KO_43610 [Saprospiraceae bacterium]
MTRAAITSKLRAIFTQYFHISSEAFNWETPLETLQEDFKILSYSVYLEQLLFEQFGAEIPIIENISTAIHTPNDVLVLIINEL